MPDLPAAPDPAPVGLPSFWDGLYAERLDGWELGGPAPPLADLAAAGRLPSGRAAVPGCGRGHDVRLLAERGIAAWGFDFSATAVAEARRLTPPGLPVRFEQRDLFDLPRDYPGFFDWVWEYTCFCAIDPGRRGDYIEAVRGILRPGGVLVALFYPMTPRNKPGPPFLVTQEEIGRLLAPHFILESTEVPARSVPRRQGEELLVRARRRE